MVSVPVVKKGDRVGTRWGEAVVVKVHGDGDVECEWKGWEGRYCLWKNELYVLGMDTGKEEEERHIEAREAA